MGTKSMRPTLERGPPTRGTETPRPFPYLAVGPLAEHPGGLLHPSANKRNSLFPSSDREKMGFRKFVLNRFFHDPRSKGRQ